MKQNYEIVLEHHGVKGMKWGVRKKYKKLEREGVSAIRKLTKENNKAGKYLSSAGKLKIRSERIEKKRGRETYFSKRAKIKSNKKLEKSMKAGKRVVSEWDKLSTSIDKAAALNPKIKIRPKTTTAIRFAKALPMSYVLGAGKAAEIATYDKHLFREYINEYQKMNNLGNKK